MCKNQNRTNTINIPPIKKPQYYITGRGLANGGASLLELNKLLDAT